MTKPIKKAYLTIDEFEDKLKEYFNLVDLMFACKFQQVMAHSKNHQSGRGFIRPDMKAYEVYQEKSNEIKQLVSDVAKDIRKIVRSQDEAS